MLPVWFMVVRACAGPSIRSGKRADTSRGREGSRPHRARVRRLTTLRECNRGHPRDVARRGYEAAAATAGR